MTALAFDVDDCCAPWRVEGSWKDGESVSKCMVVCEGCGQRRVITATSRPARRDEAAKRHLEAV